MDLNLLRVFETVYREQHLTRAAEALALTPSAVSHALRRLREQLGDPLFVRDGKLMRPTPACLRQAPALIAQLAQLRQLLQQWGHFDPGQSRQRFRIGMPDAVELMLLPALQQAIFGVAPLCSMVSAHFERGSLGRQLAAGQLDLAIDVALPMVEPVRHAHLLSDAFCLLARQGHPLQAPPALPDYLAARHVADHRAAGVLEGGERSPRRRHLARPRKGRPPPRDDAPGPAAARLTSRDAAARRHGDDLHPAHTRWWHRDWRHRPPP